MATIVRNEKLFDVVKTTNVECIEWGGYAICDHCNIEAGTGYLVCVLNSWICPKCFNKWYEHAIRYPEDVPYESSIMKEMINNLEYVDSIDIKEDNDLNELYVNT